ncbi:MAG: transcriptional repressor [Leptospiraceae bacterium]|nr:transcriptional repressor [Leptospiraceae bacterium]MCP5500284.1 transcriptional repressor [Leptospiraceae bacterium]
MKKLTKHRRIILENLRDRRDHPSARMVFESTRKITDKISFATVYNSLEFLVQEGLVKKLSINTESARYDGVLDSHSHLVCRNCSEVFDYPEVDITRKLNLNAYGFTPEEISITIIGLCENCVSMY